MALAERPQITAEEKEALLGRLRAMYPDPPEPEPDDRVWHSLGIELEEPEAQPAADAGMVALRRLFVLLDRRRPAWQRDALCIEYADTVTWFPARGESVQPAKDVCARCLVAEECHAYAIEIDAPAGIWAGTSAGSRRRDAA